MLNSEPFRSPVKLEIDNVDVEVVLVWDYELDCKSYGIREIHPRFMSKTLDLSNYLRKLEEEYEELKVDGEYEPENENQRLMWIEDEKKILDKINYLKSVDSKVEIEEFEVQFIEFEEKNSLSLFPIKMEMDNMKSKKVTVYF